MRPTPARARRERAGSEARQEAQDQRRNAEGSPAGTTKRVCEEDDPAKEDDPPSHPNEGRASSGANQVGLRGALLFGVAAIGSIAAVWGRVFVLVQSEALSRRPLRSLDQSALSQAIHDRLHPDGGSADTVPFEPLTSPNDRKVLPDVSLATRNWPGPPTELSDAEITEADPQTKWRRSRGADQRWNSSPRLT